MFDNKKMTNKVKTISIFIATTIFNIGLTILLISILADGIFAYTTGFYILSPFMIGLSMYVFYFLYKQTLKFRLKKIGSQNYSWTLGFVLLNILILIFNFLCWTDLYDGKTEALLP